MNKKLTVTVYPRVHITLINMSESGYRRNGGIGFSIQDPKIEISATYSDEFNIVDTRKIGFSQAEKDRILEKVLLLYSEENLFYKLKYTINSSSPTHFGFGTSTAVRLACLEALLLLNDKKYTAEYIAKFSGRGGTSGIGVTTYFEGGFVFDLGVKFSMYQNKFLPSSANEYRRNMPLKFVHLKMPEWQLGILIPHDIPRINESQEVEFFQNTCPIETIEVNNTLHEAVFGISASIIENDLQTFCASVNAIQTMAWKYAERNLYGDKLSQYERVLSDLGALCIGMSSLGPSLYFIASDYERIQEQLEKKEMPCQLFITKPSNSGRDIYYA